MIDVELLIIEVQKYEYLWNTKSKLFMDQSLKKKSWNDIGKIVLKLSEQIFNTRTRRTK